MPLVATFVPRSSGATPGALAVGRPPRGSTPALFGAQINALLGWRGLRDGARHHQIGLAGDDTSDSGTFDDPERIAIPRSVVSNSLWIGLVVKASEGKGGDPPEVTAQIETDAGAAIDGPIEWDFPGGYLPASPAQLEQVDDIADDLAIDDEAAWAILWARAPCADRWIQSGWDRSDGAEPRLLELGDTVAPAWGVGDPLFLRITATTCRVYGVTWAEAWQPILPDP